MAKLQQPLGAADGLQPLEQQLNRAAGHHGEENGDAAREMELETEREKHRRRAARFGTEYKAPEERRDMQHAKQEQPPAAQGFKTGVDLFSDEQRERARQRASRFGTTDTLDAKVESLRHAQGERQRKRDRAERFNMEVEAEDETGQEDADLFEERHDAARTVERRLEAIHLYGVDLMSTRDCLAYFKAYQPTRVEWLDDSSCNIVFADQHTARLAIATLGTPLLPEDAPDGIALEASEVEHLTFLWHRGHDFHKDGTAIPLLFRAATVEDVKEFNGQHKTRRLWVKPGAAAKVARRQRQRRQANPLNPSDEPDGAAAASMREGKPIRQKRAHPLDPFGGDVEMEPAKESKGQRKKRIKRMKEGAPMEVEEDGEAQPRRDVEEVKGASLPSAVFAEEPVLAVGQAEDLRALLLRQRHNGPAEVAAVQDAAVDEDLSLEPVDMEEDTATAFQADSPPPVLQHRAGTPPTLIRQTLQSVQS